MKGQLNVLCYNTCHHKLGFWKEWFVTRAMFAHVIYGLCQAPFFFFWKARLWVYARWMVSRPPSPKKSPGDRISNELAWRAVFHIHGCRFLLGECFTGDSTENSIQSLPLACPVYIPVADFLFFLQALLQLIRDVNMDICWVPDSY